MMFDMKRVNACLLRYFYAMRDYSRMFELLFWPMIDIAWMGLIALWAQSASESQVLLQIFIMALVLWQVIYRAHYEICINILDDVLDHNLINFVASPLRKREWILSMILSGFLKSIFALFFGALIGYIFFKVNIFSMGLALIPFVWLCMISGWIIGFITAGLIIYKGAKLQQIPWVVIMLVAIVSAVYYPLEVLPTSMQLLSKSLPMSYIFEGMREMLLTGKFAPSYLWASTLLSCFYLALSIAFFIWYFEKSRQRGLDRLN